MPIFMSVQGNTRNNVANALYVAGLIARISGQLDLYKFNKSLVCGGQGYFTSQSANSMTVIFSVRNLIEMLLKVTRGKSIFSSSRFARKNNKRRLNASAI
jgi:hypothetical protein